MAAGDVVINGVTVDIDDPCALVKELRKAELMLATGGGIVRARFGDDDVQFSSASLSALRELINRYEVLCAAKCGTRLRYAKRMRFVR
ncbi:hypothetical protein ACVCNR_00785 [Aquamicrobium terrae]